VPHLTADVVLCLVPVAVWLWMRLALVDAAGACGRGWRPWTRRTRAFNAAAAAAIVVSESRLSLVLFRSFLSTGRVLRLTAD
jgi:hypothetical protein